MSGLLDDIDQLYEVSVTEPDRCTEQFYVDWADEVAAGEGVDKRCARSIRRALSMARRLAAFWLERDMGSAPEDWRARVDVALGPRAWRPQLELAEYLLERDGSARAFDVVSGLFPVVNNQPYLDGITFEEWSEGRE